MHGVSDDTCWGLHLIIGGIHGQIHEHWTGLRFVNNAHREDAGSRRWASIISVPDFPESFIDDPHMHAL